MQPQVLCCSASGTWEQGAAPGYRLVPTRVLLTLLGAWSGQVAPRWGPACTHLFLAQGAGLQGQGGSTRLGENVASLQPSLALIKSSALTCEHPNQIKTNGIERFINWSCITRVNYQIHLRQIHGAAGPLAGVGRERAGSGQGAPAARMRPAPCGY